jgi:hypothetical protein
MKTRRMVYPVILVLMCFLLPIIVGACSNLLPAGANSGSGLDVQAQVDTQVAATLVGYLVQTKVAANLTSGQVTQEAAVQQAPSATPAPTETPLPPTATPIPPTEPPPPPPTATEAPVAAAVVSASAPEISASVNTNCRQGPSMQYRIVGYLMVGAKSTVYGRDPSRMWWYILNPNRSDQYCWVWAESTIVTGSVSGLPVVPVAQYAENEYNPWYTSQYYGDYGYGYYGNGYGYGTNWCTPYYNNGKVYCIPNNIFCTTNYWWNCKNWKADNYCLYWPNSCKCKNWPNCNKKPTCPPIINNANYSSTQSNYCGRD